MAKKLFLFFNFNMNDTHSVGTSCILYIPESVLRIISSVTHPWYNYTVKNGKGKAIL